MNEYLLNRIDLRAKAEGVSRSELIRKAIQFYLNDKNKGKREFRVKRIVLN